MKKNIFYSKEQGKVRAGRYKAGKDSKKFKKK